MKSNAIKCFALIGIVLFLGMVIAPSVNAGVVKDAVKKRVEERKKDFLQNFKELKSHVEILPRYNPLLNWLLIIFESIYLISNKLSDMFYKSRNGLVDRLTGFTDSIIIIMILGIFLLPLIIIQFPLFVAISNFLRAIADFALQMIETIESLMERNQTKYSNQIRVVTSILSHKIRTTL
jgi:hypothetical protein